MQARRWRSAVRTASGACTVPRLRGRRRCSATMLRSAAGACTQVSEQRDSCTQLEQKCGGDGEEVFQGGSTRLPACSDCGCAKDPDEHPRLALGPCSPAACPCPPQYALSPTARCGSSGAPTSPRCSSTAPPSCRRSATATCRRAGLRGPYTAALAGLPLLASKCCQRTRRAGFPQFGAALPAKNSCFFPHLCHLQYLSFLPCPTCPTCST